MKRVGIITMFYKSINAGGVLQAYALTYWIRKQGYHCEQINYDVSPRLLKHGHFSIKNIIFFAKSSLKSSFNHVKKLFCCRELVGRHIHYKAFKDKYVPSTRIVYNQNSIVQCADNFDVFIAGGDQIWNGMSEATSAYLLDFVEKGKVKASYAASLTALPLNQQQKKQFVDALADYSGVAVREDIAAEYMTDLIGRKVYAVVDPVFLLNTNDWDFICAKRVIFERYIFVYMLGTDERQVKWIKTQAYEKGLKVVAISHASGVIRKEFLYFADVVIDISDPTEFLSLIKYADYIYTDSFHALAFSLIFQKEFLVFNRTERKEMMARILTLLKLTEAEDRLVKLEDDSATNIEMTYKEPNLTKLNERISESKTYLMRNLTAND